MGITGRCPKLKALAFRRAELQLGHSGCVQLGALTPETSGVKALDPTTLLVGTEVLTSCRIVLRQHLSKEDSTNIWLESRCPQCVSSGKMHSHEHRQRTAATSDPAGPGR